MFDRLKARQRRHKRRKSMRLRKGRGSRGVSRIHISNFGPVIKIGALVVSVAGLACLIIFLIVPMLNGQGTGGAAPTPSPTVSPTPTPAPIAKADMSEDSHELVFKYKSVNDPYVYGNEVVFSTGNQMQSAPELTTIAIIDINTEESTEVQGITKKYTSLFEPKINEKYIVYLDCKTKDGGAVCGYDRESGKSFVMREYLFGKPKVSLVGDYALWTQQTGGQQDKLYLYHLPTRESTTIEVFDNTPFSMSAAFMSEDALIYVQPYGESQVLKGSAATNEAEIVIMPLTEGGDKKAAFYRPGTHVYDPMIDGDDIVFLDGNRDDTCNLLHSKKSGDTYSTPKVIEQGVLNYKVGDGYVAYTKDEGVFIYYFKDGSKGRLSSDSTKAMLWSANGKNVIWYDISDGLDAAANVVLHIKVP